MSARTISMRCRLADRQLADLALGIERQAVNPCRFLQPLGDDDEELDGRRQAERDVLRETFNSRTA